MPDPVRLKAMDLLARREHSRLELQRKLSQRDFEMVDIAPVLDALEQERLLSDARFATSYIRARALKGFGPVRIRLELQDRGVDEGYFKTAFEEALQELETSWEALALQAAHKKKTETLAKLQHFLQYRGFSFDQVQSAMASIKRDAHTPKVDAL